MISTYTVNEVEEISGVTRRTISDYISKGILAGPSQRGRGARYSQSDVDILMVIPRIRTLMKREFPALKTVASFLSQLSMRDLNQLSSKNNEETFVMQVRQLRVRNQLTSLLPHVAPERIDSLLHKLTPGQIQALDTGRSQLGSVLNILVLMKDYEGGSFHWARESRKEAPDATNSSDEVATSKPSWSASWLNSGSASEYEGDALPADDVGSLSQVINPLEQKAAETATDLRAIGLNDDTPRNLPIIDDQEDLNNLTLSRRLADISLRLKRMETILES